MCRWALAIAPLVGVSRGLAQPTVGGTSTWALLRGSNHIVLARERVDEPLMGFVAAISDGILSACISFLEVRSEYRGRGVGTELVTRLLALVGDLYMVDVMCDVRVRPFYERLGFTAASGAAIRRRDCAMLRR